MLPPDIPYFTDWMMVRFTTISGNIPSQTSWGSVEKRAVSWILMAAADDSPQNGPSKAAKKNMHMNSP